MGKDKDRPQSPRRDFRRTDAAVVTAKEFPAPVKGELRVHIAPAAYDKMKRHAATTDRGGTVRRAGGAGGPRRGRVLPVDHRRHRRRGGQEPRVAGHLYARHLDAHPRGQGPRLPGRPDRRMVPHAPGVRRVPVEHGHVYPREFLQRTVPGGDRPGDGPQDRGLFRVGRWAGARPSGGTGWATRKCRWPRATPRRPAPPPDKDEAIEGEAGRRGRRAGATAAGRSCRRWARSLVMLLGFAAGIFAGQWMVAGKVEGLMRDVTETELYDIIAQVSFNQARRSN